MTDKLVEALILAVLVIFKLVLTGFLLIIGFRLGGAFMDKQTKNYYKKKTTKKGVTV